MTDMDKILAQGQAMMKEQDARRNALVQWLASQEIDKAEQIPFLAMAVGYLTAMKQPGNVPSAAIGLTLVEQFIQIGAYKGLQDAKKL